MKPIARPLSEPASRSSNKCDHPASTAARAGQNRGLKPSRVPAGTARESSHPRHPRSATAESKRRFRRRRRGDDPRVAIARRANRNRSAAEVWRGQRATRQHRRAGRTGPARAGSQGPSPHLNTSAAALESGSGVDGKLANAARHSVVRRFECRTAEGRPRHGDADGQYGDDNRRSDNRKRLAGRQTELTNAHSSLPR